MLLYSSIGIAQQGNYKYNNFGNRSILLSGNVTGGVTDIGLVFYNPSRLAQIESSGFAFNAKAYQLNSLSLTTELNEEQQLESNSFGGVPSMAGGTFKVFGERFAYAFLSRRRSDLSLNTSSNKLTSNILDLFPDAQTYNLDADINTRLRENWYGLTWALKITDNLHLGISGFGTFYIYSGSRSISHTVEYDQNAVAYYLVETGFNQKSYGLLFKIGASYKLNDIDLGLNINLPYIEVYEEGGYNYNEVISGVGNGADVFYDYSFKDLDANRKEPLGISLGAGIPIKKSRIHLNLDYVSALSDYARIIVPSIDIGESQPTPISFNEERNHVFNFGVGAELYINEKFKSYMGFSTDFNAYETNATAFDLSTDDAENTVIGTDYYHFSGGIDWKTSWANIILGVTYASGKSEFNNPFLINLGGVDFENTQNSALSNKRYQFIIGLEIPFVDSALKKIKDKTQ